jgi:CRISPR-associated protein Csm4
MKVYKLKFHSSFHLAYGNAVDGPSENFIRSDTLFSAICSAANKFYGDEVVSEFLKEGQLILSSAFPFYKDEFFFPKPLNFYPDIKDYEVIKTFKKIKFVSKEHLDKIFNKENYEGTNYFNKNEVDKFILNGCWRTKGNGRDEVIFETIENPHIITDRLTNSTQIFYKTEVFFSKDSGLFFFAKIKEKLLSKFETVLRFLGDEGIGADRTVGKGLFEVKEVNEILIPKVQESDLYYLLSLYSPTKDEFENILPLESFYDFEIRKGWITNNTLNRKSLRMFAEGSVLKMSSKSFLNGRIHKVLAKEDFSDDILNDVYRSGQVITIPIAGGLNGNNY